MKSKPYIEGLRERLQDPDYAVDYLNAARQDSEEGFLLALKDVVDARQGMSKVAEAAGVNRENLYRMLSETGNPRLHSFSAVLSALDFEWRIVPKSHDQDIPGPDTISRRSRDRLRHGKMKGH